MEEWIVMLLSLNAGIMMVRLLGAEKTCDCKEKYEDLLDDKDEDYNRLVEEFNNNDGKHVDDYNKLLEDNQELEAHVANLEEQLDEKSERAAHFRKRVYRLGSRLARNRKPQLE
jgi:chromosome condensin MukBEF ATPase and DNA-binding subunit MukB